ncbi:hypothetical protein A3Q56_03326 [Intoshia linei]|uniref:Uncharacterized protein n=1 Tax=Intoshia linei TaxID=1819745 RepID=A0A177B3Z8_9BILA|nr:hypothetical protein A3Q56_03326 [Intoshia linei]
MKQNEKLTIFYNINAVFYTNSTELTRVDNFDIYYIDICSYNLDYFYVRGNDTLYVYNMITGERNLLAKHFTQHYSWSTVSIVGINNKKYILTKPELMKQMNFKDSENSIILHNHETKINGIQILHNRISIKVRIPKKNQQNNKLKDLYYVSDRSLKNFKRIDKYDKKTLNVRFISYEHQTILFGVDNNCKMFLSYDYDYRDMGLHIIKKLYYDATFIILFSFDELRNMVVPFRDDLTINTLYIKSKKCKKTDMKYTTHCNHGYTYLVPSKELSSNTTCYLHKVDLVPTRNSNCQGISNDYTCAFGYVKTNSTRLCERSFPRQSKC